MQRSMSDLEDTEMNQESDSDDSDPVVRTVEVYVNRAQDTDVHLIQYPLRPVYRPYYNSGPLQSVGIHKDGSMKMEFEVRANVSSHMILATREETELEDVKKLVLKSSPKSDVPVSNGAAFFKDGNLYIFPVEHVHQMKPDFTALEEEQERTLVESEKLKSSEKNDDLKTDDSKAEAAVSNLISSILDNPYPPIDVVHDSSSQESADLIDLLTTFEVPDLEAAKPTGVMMVDAILGATETSTEKKTTRVSESPLIPEICFKQSLDTYLKTCCGNLTNRSYSDSAGPLSYVTLSKMNYVSQIKHILLQKHTTTFDSMKSLLTRVVEDEKILEVLKKNCVLLAGNWVCQSSLVYESPFDASCRDLILLLLKLNMGKSLGVEREKLRQKTKLSLEKITKMLKEISHFRDTTWHFNLPVDDAFIQKHPNLHTESEAFWDARKTTVVNEVQQGIKDMVEKFRAEQLAKAKT